MEKEKEKEAEPIVYVTVSDISKRKTRQASKGYQAVDSREISFEQGDLLLIFDADESGWCEGALLVPSLSPCWIVTEGQNGAPGCATSSSCLSENNVCFFEPCRDDFPVTMWSDRIFF